MTLLKYICVILFTLPTFCKTQSICIDSSTLKSANIYLIKGAKAREENRVLKQRITLDSTYIQEQQNSILKQAIDINNANTKLSCVSKICKYSLSANLILLIWVLL